MPEVDFCATGAPMTCAAESAVSLVLIISSVIFGFYSYKQTRGRQAYLREKFTSRHLTKLSLSSVLALVSFVFVVYYIFSAQEDELVSLKTVLTWGLSCFLWVFNSMLIRREYKCLGYTTKYLRYGWISVFICQSILLVFAALGENTDSTAHVALIYVLNEIIIFSIIVIGYTYADDFPPEKPKENYESLLDDSSAVREIEEEFYKNSVIMERSPISQSPEKYQDLENGEADTFRPFISDDEGSRPGSMRKNPDSMLNRTLEADTSSYSRDKPKVKKVMGSTASNKSSGAQINLREDIKKLDTIHVSGYEQIIRDNKETIVYNIDFVVKGIKMSTKRSYNEFDQLRKEIKRDKIAVDLPELPSKKGIGKTRDEESLLERKECFDRILKVLVSERVGYQYLVNFLQSPVVVPHYGKADKSSVGTVESLQKTNTNVERNVSDKEVKAKVLDKNPARGNIVADYTHQENVKNSNSGGLYYNVDMMGVSEGLDGSKYYKMSIKNREMGSDIVINRRYNDFKAFHEALKKSVNDKRIIPELPYKGNVKGIALRDDPRVIEFRRVALKTYLQNIINNPKLQNNPVVQRFLQPSSK